MCPPVRHSATLVRSRAAELYSPDRRSCGGGENSGKLAGCSANSQCCQRAVDGRTARQAFTCCHSVRVLGCSRRLPAKNPGVAAAHALAHRSGVDGLGLQERPRQLGQQGGAPGAGLGQLCVSAGVKPGASWGESCCSAGCRSQPKRRRPASWHVGGRLQRHRRHCTAGECAQRQRQCSLSGCGRVQ